MIKSFYDTYGVVAANHGDFGDMCNRTFAYYTLSKDYNIVNYKTASMVLEYPTDGVYLRGMGTTKNWWYTAKTTSRDQLCTVVCAHVVIGDAKAARRHFKAWVRRFGFAQNVRSNYTLNPRIPDVMTPTLLGNFIRACRFDGWYWLLPLLDLGYVVDVWEIGGKRWDAEVQSIPMIVAANTYKPTFISRWTLKQFKKRKDIIRPRLATYFAEPYANCLPEFTDIYMKGLERCLN